MLVLATNSALGVGGGADSAERLIAGWKLARTTAVTVALETSISLTLPVRIALQHFLTN